MRKFLKLTFLYFFVAVLTLMAVSGDAYAIKDDFKKNVDLPRVVGNETTGIFPSCRIEGLVFPLTSEGSFELFEGDFNIDDVLGDFSVDVDDPWCYGTFGAAFVAARYGGGYGQIAAFLGTVGVSTGQFIRASKFYNGSELCGEDWFLPQYPNGDNREKAVFGPYEGSYAYKVEKCLFGSAEEQDLNCEREETINIFGGKNIAVTVNKGIKEGIKLSNRTYREYIYGGKEYVDNSCTDSSSIRNSFEDVRGGGAGNGQTYYMTGRFLPNYACERFAGNLKEFNCCLERSQNAMCITSNYGNDYRFCTYGRTCELPLSGHSDVTLEISNIGSRLCATTTNLCPYNHNLAGGTRKVMKYSDEFCKPNEEVKGCFGEAENFCQLYKHCSLIPGRSVYLPKIFPSPYFDRACLNFVGSTQNADNYGGSGTTSYNVENVIITPSSYSGFTSPFVECIKETMENIFLNKAGHSECENPGEYPDRFENCRSGNYYYYKGQNLSGISDGAMYQSTFSLVQTRIRDILRLLVVFVIMIYGVNIIIGAGGLERKTLIILAVKIGLVYYFAIGNAWRNVFFDGVYNASTTIGEIIIKVTDYHAREFEDVNIDVSSFDENKLDGCQFTEQNNPNYYRYGDRTYLSIFDTVDCKIFKYLGAAKSGPLRIFTFILASIFVGPIGILLFLASILFVVFLITFVIKAVYVFIISFISLLILIYVSPIIIPLVLFKKTKGIFDKWLQNMIGFIMQPVILYVYLAIFLVILDSILTGSARFSGVAPKKQVDCASRCETPWGSAVTDKKNEGSCLEDENIWIDPMKDSLLCTVINSEMVKADPTWKVFGLWIPNLAVDTITFIRMFFSFLKAVFVVYVFSLFLGLIPGIAKNLTSGAGLPGTAGVEPVGMMQRIGGLMGGARTAIGGRAGRIFAWGGDKLLGRKPLVKDRTAKEKLAGDVAGVAKFAGEVAGPLDVLGFKRVGKGIEDVVKKKKEAKKEVELKDITKGIGKGARAKGRGAWEEIWHK